MNVEVRVVGRGENVGKRRAEPPLLFEFDLKVEHGSRSASARVFLRGSLSPPPSPLPPIHRSAKSGHSPVLGKAHSERADENPAPFTGGLETRMETGNSAKARHP